MLDLLLQPCDFARCGIEKAMDLVVQFVLSAGESASGLAGAGVLVPQHLAAGGR
jgi:hypothetical protein